MLTMYTIVMVASGVTGYIILTKIQITAYVILVLVATCIMSESLSLFVMTMILDDIV